MSSDLEKVLIRGSTWVGVCQIMPNLHISIGIKAFELVEVGGELPVGIGTGNISVFLVSAFVAVPSMLFAFVLLNVGFLLYHPSTLKTDQAADYG